VDAVGTTEEGTSATPMIAYLRSLGLRAARHNRMRIRQLERALGAGRIAIVDLDGTHWSLVHAMSRDHVWLADPSSFSMPRARMSRAKFRTRWTRMCILVSEVPRRRNRRVTRQH
jgi:ABC-type bacteriocin/lantibiotic exporter with double-glycine peptidase domain